MATNCLSINASYIIGWYSFGFISSQFAICVKQMNDKNITDLIMQKQPEGMFSQSLFLVNTWNIFKFYIFCTQWYKLILEHINEWSWHVQNIF